MQDKSTSLLTINSDGSFVGDEIPKIDTLPKEIFNCENNRIYGPSYATSQHIEGMYSASNGNMIITVSKYKVGYNDRLVKYIQPVSAAYTILGSTMTLVLTLAGGEKWQVIFIK